MNDIFYICEKGKELEMLCEAKDKAYFISCEELDCSKSFARTTTTKTFDEIVNIYRKSSFHHFVFILRHEGFGKAKHIETGLRCTNKAGNIDYFIFLELDWKHLGEFIGKYKLKTNGEFVSS